MKKQISAELARAGEEFYGAQEQLAATQEILRVISKSRSDETPVFDAILSNAAKLCQAPMAWLLLVNDSQTGLSLAAYHGSSRRALDIGQTWLFDSIDQFSGLATAIAQAKSFQDEDLRLSPAYLAGEAAMIQLVDEEGLRTRISVPLLLEDKCIGAIVLSRREVKPFSDDEIRLVDSFAKQAVIAIENVRQFRELQTRLERETATKNILGVISKSRDDEGPVFDSILANACHLCDAPLAGLVLVDDDRKTYKLRASRGAKPEFVEALKKNPPDLDPERFAAARAIVEQRVVHIDDLASPDLYGAGDKHRLNTTQIEGIRTVLFVPLIWDQQCIGAIGLWRREVKPFSKDEIELVETFAAQAVIAIENVRQFRELHTQFEREAATREILQAISRSREDERPVFQTVLKAATRLCNATSAALLLGHGDNATFYLAALQHNDSTNPQIDEDRVAQVNATEMKMDPKIHVAARAICTGEVVHIADLIETESYRAGEPTFKIMVDEQGQRSALSVPLLKAEGAIGTINLHRRTPGLFSDDEVALIRSFADQAVIAIQNSTQFREVQERLRRERASAEVLRVISQSRDDEIPVFNRILGLAAELCDAPTAGLQLVNEDRTRFGYICKWGEDRSAFDYGETWPLDDSPLMIPTAIREARVVHNPDISDDTIYRSGNPTRVRLVEEEGIRTYLVVPLIQGTVAIGTITLIRREVRPFSDDEISLVETFAAQAVIAIENVRQFKALETLNAELGDRVDEQVDEIERIGRLKRFLPAAVADTVVSSGSEKLLKSHRALLGVLFCDIRGFTAFCETAEPEETIEVLQTYHEEMGKLINAHGAGVDHRMGDGVMVLFNDPLPCDDPAGDAVRLAIEMRARMSELCRTWKRMGYRLGFGVGVSLGYATVGMVGFEGRFDYTASGTAINLASRLCDEADDGEILLSPKASIAVEDDFQIESRGEISLKGLREPLEVFRLAATIAE